MLKMRTLVLGGLAVAAAATALKNRDKVAGLIGARSSAPEPSRPEPGPAPTPGPSNYDAPGPVANTATPVPAPEPVVRGEGGIDEKAEEEAAAAEAAAIGGSTPSYAGTELGEEADEETRPLMEAGEGEAEGFEQAEALLQDNAEPSAGDPIEAERQIDEVLEGQQNLLTGEREEAVAAAPAGEADGDMPVEDDERAGAAGDPVLHPEVVRGEETGGGEPGGGGSNIDTASEPAVGDEESSATSPSPGTPDPAEGPDEPGRNGEASASPADQPTVEISTTPDDPSRETPASEKSVWTPPAPERSDDDSEWQTWSGRASGP